MRLSVGNGASACALGLVNHHAHWSGSGSRRCRQLPGDRFQRIGTLQCERHSRHGPPSPVSGLTVETIEVPDARSRFAVLGVLAGQRGGG